MSNESSEGSGFLTRPHYVTEMHFKACLLHFTFKHILLSSYQLGSVTTERWSDLV